MGNKTYFENLSVHMLFDSIQDFGMLLMDTKGIVHSCNKGAEKLFGYDREFVIGQQSSILYLDNKSALAENEIHMTLRYGSFEYETIMLKKNGDEFWGNLSLSAIKNNDGNVQAVLKIIRDLTDVVKIEKELRSTARYPRENPYPIMRINKEGTITFANAASRDFLTYWETEVNSFVPFNIFKMVLEALKKKSLQSLEINLHGKTYLFSLVPIHDYVNIYGFDITDKKKAMDDLTKALEKAEQSDKMKSEFLAQMSHEVRTPLNVILSYSQLLKEELEDSDNSEIEYLFTSIESGSKRLMRTMDLILNLSQVQSGSYDAKYEEINLKYDIILPLLKTYSSEAAEKSIDLRFMDDYKDPVIRGDNYSINEIFANIIDNAIKFTDKGAVTVSVNYREDSLEISVKDTGRGISPAYVKDIFKPFSQEESGYTRSFDGNGLGLTLVEKYCKLNNASVSINSEKGKGSVFTITFPKI